MSPNKYYVYAYLDPRKPGKWATKEFTFDHEPFYIGEGAVDRMFGHLKEKGIHPKIQKIQKILRLGLEPIIIQVKTDLSADDVINMEASLIRQIGTIAEIDTVPRGPLTNRKIQEGPKHIFSLETRRKIAEANKNRSLETREKISRANRNRTAEVRKKLSDGSKRISTEARERASKAWKMTFSEIRDDFCETVKKAMNSDEVRDKLSKAAVKNNSEEWTIYFENDDQCIIVTNLKKWCIEREIEYKKLYYKSKSSNSFYKGVRVAKNNGG